MTGSNITHARIVKFDVETEQPIRNKNGFCIEVGAGKRLAQHVGKRSNLFGLSLAPASVPQTSPESSSRASRTATPSRATSTTPTYVIFRPETLCTQGLLMMADDGIPSFRFTLFSRSFCPFLFSPFLSAPFLCSHPLTPLIPLFSTGHEQENPHQCAPAGRPLLPHGRPDPPGRARLFLLCGPHRRHLPYGKRTAIAPSLAPRG